MVQELLILVIQIRTLFLSDKNTLSNEGISSDKNIPSNKDTLSSNESTSEDESIPYGAFPDFSNHKEVDDDLDTSDMDNASDITNIIVEENSSHNVLHQLKQVQNIRNELLEDYNLPTDPPPSPPVLQILMRSQELSLEHYVAWSK